MCVQRFEKSHLWMELQFAYWLPVSFPKLRLFFFLKEIKNLGPCHSFGAAVAFVKVGGLAGFVPPETVDVRI